MLEITSPMDSPDLNAEIDGEGRDHLRAKAEIAQIEMALKLTGLVHKAAQLALIFAFAIFREW